MFYYISDLNGAFGPPKRIMREREVERVLCTQVRKAGGLCLKFVSPGWNGAPDRVCLFPGGRMVFVEVKAPGQRARPLQEARHRQLKKLGFVVQVLDNTEDIATFIERYSASGK